LSVTPRKLQRLGLSSLVVTLPRRWVEAHGLKPGDLVYVIDEGDRLRIVPAQPSEARRSYRFDAYKLAMPQLASAALTCLYVNNINDVVMDLKGMGEEGLKYLKQTSMRLLGLEVTQLDSERASVRIVLDDSRADPKMAIKGLGSAVGNIAELLRRASSGEALGSDEVEVATRAAEVPAPDNEARGKLGERGCHRHQGPGHHSGHGRARGRGERAPRGA